MKLQLETKAFCEAVQIVSTVVPARSTKPILSNLRINALDKKVELLATDLEVGMRCAVENVTVKEKGAAVLPAGELLSILRETPDETITIEMEDTACKITGADSSYTLPGADPADFPEIPEFDDKTFLELRVDVLHELIRKTAFATAKEKTRYALNGVLLRLQENSVEMVATDGRRLAYMKKKEKNPKGTGHEIIIPRKAVDEIERVVTDEDETVKVNVLDNQIIVGAKKATICSRLVDGQFPDYKNVIPKDNDKKAELEVGSFYSAVRRAALVTSDESKSVKLSLSKGKLILSGQSTDRGQAVININAEYDGKDIEIRFNPEFLTDVLKVIGEEKVRLELKDSDRPGLIRASSEYQYLVMPVT